MDRPATPLCCTELDDHERRLILLAALGAMGGAAQAQDAAKVQPRAYQVVLENDKLRVLEFNSRPGMGVCGTGMHSHPAHLTVALTPGKVRVRTPDGKVETAENKDVLVFWSEAETHEVENISGRNMRALIVELKAAAPAKI
jgi:hypothetical protein